MAELAVACEVAVIARIDKLAADAHLPVCMGGGDVRHWLTGNLKNLPEEIEHLCENRHEGPLCIQHRADSLRTTSLVIGVTHFVEISQDPARCRQGRRPAP